MDIQKLIEQAAKAGREAGERDRQTGVRPSMLRMRPMEMPKGQRNDCTVVALAHVTGIDYYTVLEVLRTYNRRDNRGFKLYTWLSDHNGYVLGHHFQPCYRHEAVGTFLVGNGGHAAAIIDGVLHHRLPKGIRYSRCYHVTKAVATDQTAAALSRAKLLASL